MTNLCLYSIWTVVQGITAWFTHSFSSFNPPMTDFRIDADNVLESFPWGTTVVHDTHLSVMKKLALGMGQPLRIFWLIVATFWLCYRVNRTLINQIDTRLFSFFNVHVIGSPSTSTVDPRRIFNEYILAEDTDWRTSACFENISMVVHRSSRITGQPLTASKYVCTWYGDGVLDEFLAVGAPFWEQRCMCLLKIRSQLIPKWLTTL